MIEIAFVYVLSKAVIYMFVSLENVIEFHLICCLE